ncbi:MAG: aspartate--tRNA ligase [Candidatus Firestonebacteria bacterium]|nr:aspartate--tRNA ligase [Candidatus Firestonebacteria bacterium]
MEFSMRFKRTHRCGELRGKDVGQTVVLAGWVNSNRDHGGLVFIDLRDREGLTQIVFDPKVSAQVHAEAAALRKEFVVMARGTVAARSPETVNPKLPTGEIEVKVLEVQLLNPALNPPFEIDDEVEVAEEIRLRYRYLDLRRLRMQNNLKLRHRVAKAARDFLDAEGFLEIETPNLLKSTPEGARDYVVPSRIYPGHCFALPQSPQMLKQILMVAGCDRYYQIARCFRDEDLRADRQPEFTQIDLEMAFVDQDDVLSVTERMMAAVVKAARGADLPLPLPRLTHAEAMDRFGSDKPDLRFGLELVNVTDLAGQAEFKVFAEVVKTGGLVKAIRVPGGASFSRMEIDNLIAASQKLGAKGMAWFKVTEAGLESNLTKYFTPELLAQIQKRLNGVTGDLLIFIADRSAVTQDVLGRLRLQLGEKLQLIPKDQLHFSWIVDFPMFKRDEQKKRWDSEHHPFTAPHPDDIALLETDPGRMRSQSYDLVLNGNEIASGSIRIHQSELQAKIFKLIGITDEEAQEKFGFLLEAFTYGAPPHGGVAPGLDRLVMLLAGESTIRDVIAFPKTQRAQDPLTGAPGKFTAEQLEELSLKVVAEDPTQPSS